MYGNFSYNNSGTKNTACAALYDIENFMFDTWDAHGVTNQSVMMNNIGFSAYRYGINIILGNYNNITGLHDYLYNNTLYNDNLINSSGNGELNIQMNNAGTPTITHTITLDKRRRLMNADFCGEEPRDQARWHM